jgi:outer membrane protein
MKTIRTILLTALMLPMLAFAEGKMAYVDPLQAIVGSDEVKGVQQRMEGDIQDEKAKLQKLGSEIQQINQRMEKEGMTLSEKEKKQLQNEREYKMNEYQSLSQLVQKRLQTEQQEIMERMQPKFMTAVEQVAQEEGLEMVVSSQALLYAKPDMDITLKVTQKINQMQ